MFKQKNRLSCFIWILTGVIEVDTNPKRKFVSFKVTPSNDRGLCVYAPSGHNTREELARGHFFEGLQNYTEKKSEGNENRIILGDFNFTIDNIDREVEIKHKILMMWFQLCPAKTHRG